jgi:hypothetical protein
VRIDATFTQARQYGSAGIQETSRSAEVPPDRTAILSAMMLILLSLRLQFDFS